MTQPLRVLVIDDNKSDRLLVIRELRREFEQLDIKEIISPGDFSRALEADEFDAVITDFQLRWTTGIEILEAVKHRYSRCPVIMFTNTGTEEIAVEAMKLGLDDYIIKEPNRYIRVPASVRLALERIQIQQRAALLEIRLQGLLNQVKIGIFRSNSDGTLIEANPAFLELLGVTSLKQATNMNLLDMRDRYEQLTKLSPPQRQEQEVHLQRSNETPFWALLTTTLNVVEGITVVDGLLEDITKRKQSEMALQELNTTLEARVQERTAQLNELNQNLEEFAYSVSHDLRAPLRIVQGYAQILLEDIGSSLNPEHLEYLRRIFAKTEQLNTLIADLLAYSRLQQTDSTLESVTLSLTLTKALTQLEPEIQQRQAQIQIDDPLPIVKANRLILIQVLINLLSNAIKFVPDGVQPKVRIWAEQLNEDLRMGNEEVGLERVELDNKDSPQSSIFDSQLQIRLWIEDNGVGISQDNQQQIFNPFTRLHSEEEYPGTGIGLAIARKGVERMGGQIGVESQLGQGSRFWIKLPMVMERP